MGRNMWLQPRAFMRIGCAVVMGLTAMMCSSEDAQEMLKGSVAWHSSPIDWCERNYEVTDSVAEFWNTISGAVIFPVAGTAYLLHKKIATTVEPTLVFCLMSLFGVGLGSIYFHATLSKLGQILDEISICWVNYYAILLILPRERLGALLTPKGRELLLSTEVLTTVVIVTPVWALFSPIFSHCLTVATIVLLPWAIIRRYRVYQTSTESPDPSLRRTLIFACLSHGTAVTMWLLDRVLCGPITDLFHGYYPQLHAFWHVFVFLGGYFTVVVLAFLRSEGDGYHSVICESYGIPYATIDV